MQSFKTSSRKKFFIRKTMTLMAVVFALMLLVINMHDSDAIIFMSVSAVIIWIYMFSRTQSQIRDLNKIDEFKIDDRGCYLMAGKNTFGQLAWNEVEEVFHAGSGYDLHLIFKLKKGSKKVAWPDGLHILPRQAKYSGGDIFLGDVFEESILVVAKKCEEKRAQINDSDQKISNPKDIN